jgi:hypothetical protein
MKDEELKIKFHFRIGIPDGYGRVYTEESIKRAIEKFNEKAKDTLIISESSAPVTQWAGAVKEMRINDDQVEADIITIDTPPGRALKCMLSEGAPVKFVPTFVDGAMTKVNMVLAPSIDVSTYETLAILCETFNARIKELDVALKVQLHEDCKMYVQYKGTPPRRGWTITGYWLSYDTKTNKIRVDGTDIEVDLHDPSSVDKLIHSLEELRNR